FFFATVYIFVDEYFPKDARSSAQGLFNFLILGLGPFVGNFLWSGLKEHLTTGVGAAAVVDYRSLFLYPAGLALLGAIMLLLFFNPPSRAAWSEHRDDDEWEAAGREAIAGSEAQIQAGLPSGDQRQ